MRSMQETVTLRRARPQRRDGESEFIPVIAPPSTVDTAVILPDQFKNDLGEVTIIDDRYVCNLVPPVPEIRRNDEVVRFDNEPNEEVLTVVEITTVQGIQQLILLDKTASIQ